MAGYLRFHTFRRTHPDVNSPIFEKLMEEGFSEVKGGYNSKVITVYCTVFRILNVHIQYYTATVPGKYDAGHI
jgi:hypothetical protein